METSRLFSQAAPAASSLPLWTYVQWISSLLPRAFSSFTPKYLAPLPCLLLWDSLSCLAVSCRLSWVSFSLPSLVRTEIKVFSGPSLLNPVTAVRLPTQHFTLRMMLTFCSHTQVFIILDHCPQTSPHLQKPLGKYHVQQHTHEGNSGGIMEDHCHTKKKKKRISSALSGTTSPRRYFLQLKALTCAPEPCEPNCGRKWARDGTYQGWDYVNRKPFIHGLQNILHRLSLN